MIFWRKQEDALRKAAQILQHRNISNIPVTSMSLPPSKSLAELVDRMERQLRFMGIKPIAVPAVIKYLLGTAMDDVEREARINTITASARDILDDVVGVESEQKQNKDQDSKYTQRYIVAESIYRAASAIGIDNATKVAKQIVDELEDSEKEEE